MPFIKGDERINRDGRPKGSKNRVGESVRTKIETFIDKKMNEIDTLYDKLEPKEQALLISRLVDYVTPKLRSQDIQFSEFEQYSDEQLRAIAQEVINNSNK